MSLLAEKKKIVRLNTVNERIGKSLLNKKSSSKKLVGLVGIVTVCGIAYYGIHYATKPVTGLQTVKHATKHAIVQKTAKHATKHAIVQKTVKPAEPSASLINYAKSVMNKNHLAGAIGIVKNGEFTTVTNGMADVNSMTPNSSKRVVYPIGSLQKEITGAMVMQIMRKKAFNQDTKIARWYPSLKHADQVTVGNLLTHTSGYSVPNIEYDRHQKYTDLGEVAWTINQINMTYQRPVGSSCYSDVNFVLLAGIIEKETGKSYSRNFYERVSKPLKLTHTYIRQNLPKKLHLAVSYQYNYQNAISYAMPVSTQLPGAGNLASTPADLYKIQLGLENGQILTKPEFYQLTHLKAKKNLYSGGVYLEKHETIHLAYGALDNVHYGAYMQLTADNKNGIIMLVNQCQQNERELKRIAFQILTRIKPHTFSVY